MNKFPFKTVDLTHALSKEIPTWDGSCGFNHKITCDYSDCDTDIKFRIQEVTMRAGIGTHMDAPAHCIPGGATIESLSLDNLIAPCVVIDTSQNTDKDFKVRPSHLLEFEKQHGKIPNNSFVIFYTGWDRFWLEPEKYHNDHQFPSIDGACGEFLLERAIAGIGIDTLSPDRPESGFPLHAALLGAGKYIVENVANAKNLPASGGFSLALPMKTSGGTEAPIRLIACV